MLETFAEMSLELAVGMLSLLLVLLWLAIRSKTSTLAAANYILPLPNNFAAVKQSLMFGSKHICSDF